MTRQRTITNEESGTSIEEIADDTFRISTPVAPELIPGGFTFNQFLIVDDDPLLFHTGPRGMFPLTRQAVEQVLPLDRLRYISFSHVESDECGALNDWLRAAPDSQPLCSDIAAMVSVNDLADRAPRVVGDGDRVSLGRHQLRWLATPHLPHNMECGYLFDESTHTLLCGDLFTQSGHEAPAVTTSADAIWEPSEVMRAAFPYAGLRDVAPLIDKLADTKPKLLACMHGSSFRGDGAALLGRLGDALTA